MLNFTKNIYIVRSTPIYEDAVKVITINGIGGCLRRLHPGNTYFLMGYVTSPTLSISHCDVAYNLEYDWAEETAEGLISEPPVCGEPEYYTLDEYLKVIVLTLPMNIHIVTSSL
jgi:hypothetical protein